MSAHEDQHAAVDVRTALLRPKPPLKNGNEDLCLAHSDPSTPNKRVRMDHARIMACCEPMAEFKVHHPQHAVGSGRSAEQEPTTRTANLELPPTDQRECHALLTPPATTLPRSPDVRVVSPRWQRPGPLLEELHLPFTPQNWGRKPWQLRRSSGNQVATIDTWTSTTLSGLTAA